ncbi:hypothetical protein KO493_04835 [Tamlana agarivorans]|uniref:Uncharacterized protein n=1 Tax=Pseudotamlana agarivorans TaxID=481183 RepID=A0ACC5U6T1_9FLAO|nr:hypothetical protein [Tamlana agarivorans]MBU2950019.1 hypothetical protein [Tamlana agarivorans]
MQKTTNIYNTEINEILPSLQKLIHEKDETDYQMIFVSVFDHWLTQDEFQPEIHTEDAKEIKIRREKLQNFVIGLFNLTQTFTSEIKRKNQFFIYQFETKKQLLNKCEIQNQNGESGQRYDIILPEFQAVYSEEWDWTNIIWFRDQEKIKPLIELAKKSGLYILTK